LTHTEKDRDHIHNRTWKYTAIGIVIAGSLVRLVHYINNRSLWLDESMLARNILDRGPLELLQPLKFDQGAPVLFLQLVKLVTFVFGSGELALRLVPLVGSLVSLILFYHVARLLLDDRLIHGFSKIALVTAEVFADAVKDLSQQVNKLRADAKKVALANIGRIRFEDACMTLSISGTFKKPVDLRKAKKRMKQRIHELHPDRTGLEDIAVVNELDAVRNAYETLEIYMKGLRANG